MEFIFITNDPKAAKVAIESGVDRIMVDLEVLGKVERQGHLDTLISDHNINDIRLIRDFVPSCNLTVRINPLHEASLSEINLCIEAGANTLMLPMFTSAREVRKFIDLVSDRARVCLLLETPQAYVRADSIFDCKGVDEVHIGLNDLHIGMGLSFMFELLAGGVVDSLACRLRERRIKFGFGGVARLTGGALSAALILSEHVRLGSSQVLLSRDFKNTVADAILRKSDVLAREINALRYCINELRAASVDRLDNNHQELKRSVDDIVSHRD